MPTGRGKKLEGMKQITVYVRLGLVGCKKEETFEIEEDASDDMVEEAAQEVMFSLIEWGWKHEKVPGNG